MNVKNIKDSECCLFFFPTGLFIVQTQSWVGQTSSGGCWAVLWSNPPPRNHSSLPSPLKSIVLPSSLVCIGTQWLCTWPLCFCGFCATSSIAMPCYSCLLMYSPVAQELSRINFFIHPVLLDHRQSNLIYYLPWNKSISIF